MRLYIIKKVLDKTVTAFHLTSGTSFKNAKRGLIKKTVYVPTLNFKYCKKVELVKTLLKG